VKRFTHFFLKIFSLVLVFNLGFCLKSVNSSSLPGELSVVTSEIRQLSTGIESGRSTGMLLLSQQIKPVKTFFLNLSQVVQFPPGVSQDRLSGNKTNSSKDNFLFYSNFIYFVMLLIIAQAVISFFWIKSLQKAKQARLGHEKLMKLLEASPAATMVFQKYKIIYVNSAFEILTGFHRKELLKMEVWEIIHPDSLRELSSDDIGFEEDGYNFNNELKILNKYKETKWVEFSTRTINNNGKVAVIATLHDINYRKSKQNELSGSHERYTSIVEASGDGIFDYDLTDDSLYLSPKWKEMLGYKESELKNSKETWISLVNPEDKAKIVRILENLEAGSFPSFQTEYRMKCKSGSYKWVLASFTLVQDENKKPLRILGTHTDVTDRKEAENQLRENELKYKSIFTKNSAVILITDADTGDILDANRSAIEYYGYDRDVLLDMNIRDINVMSPEEIENEKQKANDENREFFNFRHKLINGDIRDVEVYNSNIRIKGKNLQTSIVFDISRSKKIENELQKAKETAEEANRVKSFFISNLSHEIRTPLNSVIGLAQLIIDENNLTQDQMENMKSIKFSSDHLLDVINKVLDFSKIEAGKLEFEDTEFDVINLVKESSRTFEFKAREKGIDLNVSIDPGVPRVLMGDPSRLKQILLNLLSNAVKFTSDGHVSTDVKILEMQDDQVKLKFSVSDTGRGIPEDHIPRLFESFTQATKDTSRKFGGTGLGLSICKKLAELQNGKIGVKSLEGMGSTFWVELPFRISEKPKLPELGKPGSRLKNLKGIRILLVEDDKMNQFVMAKLLRKWLADLSIAENGRQAIDMLEREEFDIILMDLHMPELDGYEAAMEIRDQNSSIPKHDVPIIALTADITPETRQKVKDSGMNDFITKPIDQDSMFETINKVLINRKTEFIEKQKDIEEVTDQRPDDLSEIKQHIKLALAGIFDDDLEGTLALIARFLQEIPRAIIGINEAFYEKDLSTLNKLVHKIKPGFSYLGFTDVSDKITRIQILSKSENNIAELEDLCKDLDDESRKITRVLRELQKDYIKNNSVNI
jgi:PAS domain S-box-containing protein